MNRIKLFEDFFSIDKDREQVIELLSRSTEYSIDHLSKMSDSELEEIYTSLNMEDVIDSTEGKTQLKKININII